MSGFISAEMPPTNFCDFVSSALRRLKPLISSSSLQKARTTLDPTSVSRVAAVTLSNLPCVLRYIGIVINIMPNTTANSTAIVTANTQPADTLITNAIIIAPNTIKGERINRRSHIFTPVCTWFTSLVILVIIDEAPKPSIS